MNYIIFGGSGFIGTHLIHMLNDIRKPEDKIYDLVCLCEKLLSDHPSFFLINSYTTGLQPAVLKYMLGSVIESRHGGRVEADEVGLPVTASGLVLPCGASGRWMA